MSGWSDSLQAQAAKAFNKYNDPSMSYELNNAAEHVEFLEQRIAELEALVVDCMESDNEYLSEWDKKARALGLTPPEGAETITPTLT